MGDILLDSTASVVNMQAGSVRAPRRAVRGSEVRAVQKLMTYKSQGQQLSGVSVGGSDESTAAERG